MTQARTPNLRFTARRSRLFGGAAVLALSTLLSVGAAQAQMFGRSAAPTPPPSAPAPAVDDGLGQDGFYMEADLLIRDDDKNVITAQGEVEARYRGRVVRAQEIVYDQGLGVATARGKVTIIDANGGVETAEEVQLDQDMRAGFARVFAARLPDGSKVAAASAVRRSDTVDELNRAIYTPCEICADEPDRAPTWSVRADRVTQDRARHMVYYRNAVISMFGAPVAYLPAFWHPDPSAPAKSGFLTPHASFATRRGYSYEQPYLQVISPSSDVILTPQFNSNLNPLLSATYRKRFYSGDVSVRAGFTHERDVDGAGNRFGSSEYRSYVLARGLFDINANWRWGFSAERASDDLIFDKYGIDSVYAQRGLFNSEDHRLLSQLFALRQDENSYLSIAAVSVQGLRAGDNDRTFPTLAPLIEGRYEPDGPVLGGRLRLRGSAVMLTRDQSPDNAALPGMDSRRASLDADWRSNLTFAGGLRASPFVQARTDVYKLADLGVGTGAASSKMSITRGQGVAGVDLSLPLIRRIASGSVLLEPLAQVAISPRSDPVLIGRSPTGAPIYFNEDSLAFELDETNLFRANKFPGFDLYEGGQRLNAGLRGTVRLNNGASGTLLVGRSFRSRQDDIFPLRTGLRPKASDWVVAGQASFAGVSAYARSRLDNDTGAVRRLEAGLDLSNRFGAGSIRYLRDNLDISGVKQENLDARGQINLTPRWAVSLYGARDMQLDVWRRRDIGLVYQDDCARIELIYQHEDQFTNTPNGRSLRSNESVVLRLTLATLGGSGYGQ
jgi:LPS-assembly protein